MRSIQALHAVSFVLSLSLAAQSAAGASTIVLASSTTTAAPTAAAARHGVVVMALGPQSRALADLTWPVALAVYGESVLRPAVDDVQARVLAADAAPADATTATKELAELRGKIVSADDVASRTLLSEIARRTSAVGLVLVVAPTVDGSPVQARLYDAADDRLEASYFPGAGDGAARWTSLVTALRARYSAPVVATPASSGPSVPQPTASGDLSAGSTGGNADMRPVLPADNSGGFWSSPWLWGALIAAAAVGGATWYLSRDTSSAPTPVHITWGK